jgi:adenosylcobinamide-phosphate guanylyltransferase
MDAVLMCGGRGTRLDADVEKPMFPVDGEPMVDRVHAALEESRIDTVYAVGSPHAPRTLERAPEPTIEAPGDGYVADLGYALDRVDRPVLTVTADLPLLSADALDAVLDVHEAGSLTVRVPAALKRQLGVTVEATMAPPEEPPTCEWTASLHDRELAPTGLNVVGPESAESAHVTHDARLAVNVNRPADAAVAEALLGGDGPADGATPEGER